MPNHVVKQGECYSSIAQLYHVGDPLKIINHPNNASLLAKRKDPNVLFPGDVVFVPVDDQGHAVATARTHTFQVQRPKKGIAILLEDPEDHPLADMDYTLVVDGEAIQGKTDGKGKLENRVPVGAHLGQLTVGKFKWTLDIGNLNPIEKTPDQGASGTVQRLRNLGYSLSQDVQQAEDDIARMLASFQARLGLTVSGQLDDATKQKLVERHEQGSGKSPAAPPPQPQAVPPPKDTKPRLEAPPPGEKSPSYYEQARAWTYSWWEWAKQRVSAVAPTTQPFPTPNVLNASCTCYVCTLKGVVVQKSHEDLRLVHDKLGGKTVVPPKDAKDMLPWFHDDTLKMNIVGIRRRHSFSNKFDDSIITFFHVGGEKDAGAWTTIAKKYDLPSQDWVLGDARFVPCKRFGGYWVGLYDVSTDPGWETNGNGTEIRMRALNCGEHLGDKEYEQLRLREGEAFVCPYWYKAAWHVGPHHPNHVGGHLALVQVGSILVERLAHPQPKLVHAPWLRVYQGDKDPVDYTNVDYCVTRNDQVAAQGTVTQLDPEDVVGNRYFASGTGMNIHRGHHHPAQSGANTNTQVGFGRGTGSAYSEGCQVFASSTQFDQFLHQCMFTKWYACQGKSCSRIATQAAFEHMDWLPLIHTAPTPGQKPVPDYKQLEVYEYDRFGTCDASGACGVRFDYVLIELAAAEHDKVKAEYGKLDKNPAFKNDNKLFIGGPSPATAAPKPATPAAPKAPAACTCPPMPNSKDNPLYHDSKATNVSASDMYTAVVGVWNKMYPKDQKAVFVADVALELLGQWAIETGWSAAMMNYNFGNVKLGGAKDVSFTLFGTTEDFNTKKGAEAAATCPKHSHVVGQNEKGRWVVKFDPPHLQTYFRWYATLEDGVKAHYDFLSGKKNYKAVWAVLTSHADGTGEDADEDVERHDRIQSLGVRFGQGLDDGHYSTQADYHVKMPSLAVSAWMRVLPAEYTAWLAARKKQKLVVAR